ncbi:MAG: hypothetical protein JSV16_02310, partial [Candidatus Hydrogenedentota bacterium]
MQPLHKVPRKLHIAALLALLVFLCYGNSFNASFQYDDYGIVFDTDWNTPDYLLHTLRYMPQRFVLFSSFALNYHLNGYNVTGYHLFNTLVHAISTILVFLIALRLFEHDSDKCPKDAADPSMLAAFAVGALFGSHTILTQSVTYIQGRSSSLCTLFYLAGFYFYSTSAGAENSPTACGSGKKTAPRLFLATVAFILACMTKEIGTTLVAVLLAFEFIYVLKFRPSRLRRSTIIRLTPFVLVSAAAFMFRILTYGTIGEARPIRDFWPNLFTQFSGIVTYIRMLIVPIGLTIDHDYPVYQSLFELRVIASLVLLCGLLAAAIIMARRIRSFTFGFSWFAITLLPTTLVPLWDIISEHWIYLPSVGYFLMVGGLFRELLRHYEPHSRKRRAAIGIMLTAVFLYGTATIVRNTVWRHEFTLWSDAVRKSPNKSRPHTNLARTLVKMGEVQSAIEELRI